MNMPNPHVRTVQFAAFFGALAVVLGAFGAHALKALISEQALQNWQTAVQYQFVHALALLFLSLCPKSTLISFAGRCFVVGIFLFCGSLYGLSLRSLWAVNLSILGPITPLGGLLFIAGWVSLFLSAFKKN